MKINKLIGFGTSLIAITMLFAFSSCGLFSFFFIPACIYQVLPIVLFRLLTVRLWNSKVFRLVASVVFGLSMSFYYSFGASLTIKYLGFGENLLSYYYANNPFLMIAPIAGVVIGFLIQFGMRRNVTTEKVLFASGILMLLMMSLYTSFLIVAPE